VLGKGVRGAEAGAEEEEEAPAAAAEALDSALAGVARPAVLLSVVPLLAGEEGIEDAEATASLPSFLSAASAFCSVLLLLLVLLRMPSFSLNSMPLPPSSEAEEAELVLFSFAGEFFSAISSAWEAVMLGDR